DDGKLGVPALARQGHHAVADAEVADTRSDSTDGADYVRPEDPREAKARFSGTPYFYVVKVDSDRGRPHQQCAEPGDGIVHLTKAKHLRRPDAFLNHRPHVT